MSISLIVAMGRNSVIGNKGKMPWHLPAELHYFKKTTLGHTVVMGRKTYEAIGKALPGRKNIILTKNPGFKAEGCLTVYSVKDVLNLVADNEEIFIIGGEEVFGEFCDMADKIYLTIIDHDFEGDRFFKCENYKSWRLLKKEFHAADQMNKHSFTCYVYLK